MNNQKIMLEFFIDIDKQLFLFLNGLHSASLDWLMFHISEKLTWIPLYALILFLVIKKYKWKGLFFLLFVTLLVFMSDQGSVLMKNTFVRLRPCHEPSLEGLVHLVRGKCGGRYGFVSSHAANTFALAALVIMVLKDTHRFMIAVMLGYAILNGYSRIYLGVHYPGDVIFGALLGGGIGLVVYLLWERFAGILRMKINSNRKAGVM
jgi:undecaprenyl-diphosphatase